jgi:archaellum biogenesis protein FlaJ (TadC family)
MAKEDQELLYAVWAMEVLISSGIGLESAIKHVAEGNYGKISREFKKVLSFTKRELTETLESSLERLARDTRSKSLKKVLNLLARSLREETTVTESLRTFAERETQERETKIQAYIEKLAMVSEIFLLMALLLPIIVVVMGFIASIMPTAALASGTTKLILFANIFILIALIAWVRILESGT